jgi:hypothetical protein
MNPEKSDANVRAGRSYTNIGSFSIYLILSLIFFGRGLLGHFITMHIGVSEDPPLMMWFLVWWPHAIGTRINPMLTDAIWAPLGVNLAWETALPLLSLIAAPITLFLGPIAALNTLCLAAPPVSAWAAYILCRYVTRQYWPSLAGGYIFGFSPFIASHMTYAHLTLIWMGAPPLLCYFFLQRLNGDITARRFITSLTIVLVAQFLISHEIFATMTLFYGITLLLALGLISSDTRNRLWNLIRLVMISWTLSLLIVSPYLYCFFAYSFQRSPHWLGSNLSADALNLLVPAPSSELGLLSVFDRISGRFNTGFIGETAAYVGLPLFLIAAFFARSRRRELRAKLLVYCLAIIIICSLGPQLIFDGDVTRIHLPWALFQVPILNNAGTGRFMIYAFLLLAVVAALWLSDGRWSRTLRIGLGAVTIASLLPNLSAAYWVNPTDRVPFFTTGVYRRYLTKNETVLILPYGLRGESMYWQAQTHMYFRMAQGGSHAPGDFNVWPILTAFDTQSFMPNAREQLRSFIANHGVTAVIVTDQEYERWRSLLSGLQSNPIAIAGVHLYRLPVRATNASMPTLLSMRTDFDTRRFESAITGVQKYLTHGGSLSALSARNAVELGIIPLDSLIGPAEPYPFLRDPQYNWYRSPQFQYGLALFTIGDHEIAIGEAAWAPAVKALLAKYRPIANLSEIDLPDDYGPGAPPAYALGRFVMVFDRERLARAASLASSSPTGMKKAQVGSLERSSHDDSTH